MTAPRFGQIWTLGQAGGNTILDPVSALIVSSDLYNLSGLGVIVALIDQRSLRAPELREPVPGGTAMLDRLEHFPQTWLREHAGDVNPARHEHIARIIRNLIGN